MSPCERIVFLLIFTEREWHQLLMRLCDIAARH